LILLSSLLLAQNKISFVDFVERVSLQNNINIYIDEDLNTTNISLFIPDKISNQELFTLFDSTLTKLDFDIKKFSKTYFIQKKAAAKSHQFIYKLKYNNYKNIDSLLLSLQLQYHYIVDNNSFVITTTKEKYKDIYSLLQELDTQQNQAVLKITIFEIQDSLIKDRGIQSISSKSFDSSGIVESILSTVITTPITSTLTYSSAEFALALKFLDENKYISFSQNPYIFIKNNNPFLFNAVDNIPYLVKTTSTDSNVNQESNSIEYRDVGLKIQGNPLIYNDYVNIDLDLTIEDIVTQSDTPRTYKRYLKSNTNLEYNKVLLLSGIKRHKVTDTEYALPFLSNLPWIGELFKYTSHNVSELHIAIAIEVIQSDKFNTQDYFKNETPFYEPIDSNNSDTS
jgi:general secretion pathway protein D